MQKEYQALMQQHSSVTSTDLSGFPHGPQKCNLREQIDQELYPPSIHKDLKYDNPSMKPDINTTLNISYLRSDGGMKFTVFISGEQLNSCIYPG